MRRVVFAAMLALAGCAPAWRPAPAPIGPCRVTEEARMRFAAVRFHDVRRGTIARATNARIVRVLRKGDAATMDFREDRLTVQLDADGRISGLRCG